MEYILVVLTMDIYGPLPSLSQRLRTKKSITTVSG